MEHIDFVNPANVSFRDLNLYSRSEKSKKKSITYRIVAAVACAFISLASTAAIYVDFPIAKKLRETMGRNGLMAVAGISLVASVIFAVLAYKCGNAGALRRQRSFMVPIVDITSPVRVEGDGIRLATPESLLSLPPQSNQQADETSNISVIDKEKVKAILAERFE